MAALAWLRGKARLLKRDTLTLYFAVRDPRTPLAAKLIAGLVVAYALSPIDLIPDVIPVLGLLDELVLVPLGIALALRLVPGEVLAAARERAAEMAERPRNWVAAAVIILLWVVGAAGAIYWLASTMGK